LIGTTTSLLVVSWTRRITELLRRPLLVDSRGISLGTSTSAPVGETDPSVTIGLASSGTSIMVQGAVDCLIVFEDGEVRVGVTTFPAVWPRGDIGVQLSSVDGRVVDFGDVVTSARLGRVPFARNLT